MGMIEYAIMALVYVFAAGLAYSTGRKDGFNEAISAFHGVDTERTVH